jgi:hypothetical protein
MKSGYPIVWPDSLLRVSTSANFRRPSWRPHDQSRLSIVRLGVYGYREAALRSRDLDEKRNRRTLVVAPLLWFVILVANVILND